MSTTFEAGELHIMNDDALTPSRLRLLADEGWSVQDAVADISGFILLLTRPSITIAPVVHEGGPRCPNYCGCATR